MSRPLSHIPSVSRNVFTGRHNKFNRACRDAIAAKSTTAVILGDKGDGSAKARAAAKARYAWANADHVPDIIEKHAAHNGNHVLYESKVYTPLKTSDNLGNGTARGGGSPSTAAGNLVAFWVGATYLGRRGKCHVTMLGLSVVYVTNYIRKIFAARFARGP